MNSTSATLTPSASGQASSLSRRKRGPWSQNGSSGATGHFPRVGRSAGLDVVNNQFHRSTSVSSLISRAPTRCATNGLKWCASVRSHGTTVLESVHIAFLVILSSSCSLTLRASRLYSTAACSSSRGIVIGFRGATRVFAATSDDTVEPSSKMDCR